MYPNSTGFLTSLTFRLAEMAGFLLFLKFMLGPVMAQVGDVFDLVNELLFLANSL
jgi:hypothetical protein